MNGGGEGSRTCPKPYSQTSPGAAPTFQPSLHRLELAIQFGILLNPSQLKATTVIVLEFNLPAQKA